ncbi:MAG TPA: MFS transporter [Candidatus Limnocylindrales bacterium]|nr:MFS transporter [Candidatus Limnocylindrales bacterium]
MKARPSQDWHSLLALYWITSFVEGLGVSQIYAFLPNRLTEVGVPSADVGHLVGLLGSLFFLFGLPFIPLWGVWADKYSRKAVIIRSALVEAVVFGVVAASQAPWQLFVGMMLVGFQLGNTGVMMAAIRDVTPGHRLGLAMGLFAASSPLGFGTGPALGGFMIDQLHLPSGSVFAVAALLSIGVALMLAIGSGEVRPEVVPRGSVLRLAFGAVRGVMADPTVRWLFVVYGVVFVGRQMATQYVTLLVHAIEHTTFEVSGAVGPVFLAVIAGAALSPAGGWISDRLGFRRVLVGAIAGLAVTFVAMALAPSVAWLAVAYGVAIAFMTVVGAMVSSLLATEVPSERRSATLNLIYLPLYVGGITGPAIGAGVVGAGLRAVFYVAAGILAIALVLAVAFARRTGPAARDVADDSPRPGPVDRFV